MQPNQSRYGEYYGAKPIPQPVILSDMIYSFSPSLYLLYVINIQSIQFEYCKISHILNNPQITCIQSRHSAEEMSATIMPGWRNNLHPEPTTFPFLFKQQNFCSEGTNRKKLKILYYPAMDFKVICTTKDTSTKKKKEKGRGVKPEDGCYRQKTVKDTAAFRRERYILQ